MKDTKPLPFLTPEQAGVPSGAISRLLDRIEAAKAAAAERAAAAEPEASGGDAE